MGKTSGRKVKKVKTPVLAVAFALVLKAAKCLFIVVYQNVVSNNVFAKQYAEVNVEQLNRFEDGATADPVALIEAGILKNVRDGIRILGNGP